MEENKTPSKDNKRRKSPPSIFGLNLLRQRRKRGWSQKQLALASGIGRVTIANLERGAHQSPDALTVTKIAAALSVSPSTLWEAEIPPQPDEAIAVERACEALREMPPKGPLRRSTVVSDPDDAMSLTAFLELHGDELTGHERRLLDNLRNRTTHFQNASSGDWKEFIRILREEFPHQF